MPTAIAEIWSKKPKRQKVRFSMNADRITKARARDQLCTPVLAPLMQNRGLVALLATAAALQVILATMGSWTWPCPLETALGVAGPGCGLTRALVLLVKGQWQAAVHLHALAPIGLGIGILLLTGSLLPSPWRYAAAKHLAAFERRTGTAAWLILSVLIYWIGRMMIQV